MYTETKSRSLLKAVSWRFWATLTTTSLVFLFIGELEVALSIGVIEVVLKMAIYFLHERTWDKIKFGRHEVKPCVVWITGLSRSGKSTIAEKVTKELKTKGLKAEHLDGRNIRHLFPETGYTKKEVNEHIKRVGYLAKKLEEQNVFVVASFLSPYKESREFVRELVDNFVEVYISTPVAVCAERDTSGIFEAAKKGEVQNFPGINMTYEVSDNPELTIDTTDTSTEEASKIIIKEINKIINNSNGAFRLLTK